MRILTVVLGGLATSVGSYAPPLTNHPLNRRQTARRVVAEVGVAEVVGDALQSSAPLVIGAGLALTVALRGGNSKTQEQKKLRLSELREFDGQRRSQIYVGADGLVFDVTKAKDLYGPGGAYAAFAGRDASRMLARGSVADFDDDDAPLSLPQRAALKAWVAALKSKYDVVAELETAVDVAFLAAASDGRRDDLVRLAKQQGADVRACDASGDAAVHLAARSGSAQCCETMLELGGLDVLRARGSKARTAVHFAAEAASPDALRFLLNSGADPDALAADDWSPLHSAAQFGRTANLDLLLAHTSLPTDAISTAGVTPLLAAATFGHLDACRALLGRGADPHRPGPRSKTPADWASLKGHNHVVDFLHGISSNQGNHQAARVAGAPTGTPAAAAGGL